MTKPARRKREWIPLVVGSVLSLITFILSYYLDPLKFGSHSTLAALPAFLLSVIVLIIGHTISTFKEVEKVSDDSDKVYEAVKNYLHVTKIGTPKTAWTYIMTRLPILEYVQNTSFNFADENEQSQERLYDADIYQQSASYIAHWVDQGLHWRDIGDPTAITRFKNINSHVNGSKKSGGYEYKIISQAEPQIGFILLTYNDGSTEVLFNWDFRDIPQDPVVLLSRDHEIFNMFAAQHKGLWRVAVQDYDNKATRSTS